MSRLSVTSYLPVSMPDPTRLFSIRSVGLMFGGCYGVTRIRSFLISLSLVILIGCKKTLED